MREIRLTTILNILTSTGFVKVTELSNTLGVSKVTIRADLEYLEDTGKLRRTRGGATLPSSPRVQSTPYVVRESLLAVEKQAIAQAAANLVNDKDTIILDASSTVQALAIALRERHDLNRLTVITNGLRVVSELINCPHIQLICIGGMGLAESNCLIGPLAESVLLGLRANKAFISPHGLTVEHGLGDWSLYESSIRRTMIQVAEQLYVVADHSKFGTPSPFTIAPISKATGFVTDQPMSHEWLVGSERKPEIYVASSSSYQIA